jgi:hypothetical protein
VLRCVPGAWLVAHIACVPCCVFCDLQPTNFCSKGDQCHLPQTSPLYRLMRTPGDHSKRSLLHVSSCCRGCLHTNMLRCVLRPSHCKHHPVRCNAPQTRSASACLMTSLPCLMLPWLLLLLPNIFVTIVFVCRSCPGIFCTPQRLPHLRTRVQTLIQLQQQHKAVQSAKRHDLHQHSAADAAGS